MVSQSLPSPPAEDAKAKKHGSKSTKPTQRASKRASSSAAHNHHHNEVAHSAGMDGRHKRVWKACERCRMKKTKCDGEFPCKRCKDDGLVCTAGVRKKVEYKQLPRGYAEVLENTQLTLVATVHKLYSMVRNSQSWDLGEPDLNDRGQPVIHNIAQKLGCIRPNSDIDLPVHSVFPEDEAGMTELARQLEEQQPHELESTFSSKDVASYPRAERASSSELDHSDVELDFDYRKLAFGNNNGLTLSPSSFASSVDLEFPSEMEPSALFSTQSPSSLPNLNSWSVPKMQQQQQQQQQQTQPQNNGMAMQFLQQNGNMPALDQGMMDDFGTIKPDILSMPNQDAMMGLSDPMIYSGFDAEMRL